MEEIYWWIIFIELMKDKRFDIGIIVNNKIKLKLDIWF